MADEIIAVYQISHRSWLHRKRLARETGSIIVWSCALKGRDECHSSRHIATRESRQTRRHSLSFSSGQLCSKRMVFYSMNLT